MMLQYLCYTFGKKDNIARWTHICIYSNAYVVNGSCWKFLKDKNENRRSYLWISHDYDNDWCNWVRVYEALLNRHLLTAPIFKPENDQVKFCMFLKVSLKRSAYCAHVLNPRLCFFFLFVCFWSLYFWCNKLFILILSDLFQAFPLWSTVIKTRVYLWYQNQESLFNFYYQKK